MDVADADWTPILLLRIVRNNPSYARAASITARLA
jgi:hypothetical protein